MENYLYADEPARADDAALGAGRNARWTSCSTNREKINAILQTDRSIQRTEDWGIEVSAVEVKDVDLPPEMKRAMARQAEAERERRAKVINAEGELQAAEKLAQAAHIIGREPAAIQLRYLQTVNEIASENNSTTIFPDSDRPVQGLHGAHRSTTPAEMPRVAPFPSARPASACPAPRASRKAMA